MIPSAPRHLLIVQIWGIGDTFLTVALFKLVRRYFPNARVTALLGFREMGEILRANALVDDVVILPHGASVLHKVWTFLALWRRFHDVAIVATRHSWAYSALCRVAAGVPTVITDARHPVARLLAIDAKTDFSAHRVVANGMLLKPLVPQLTSSIVQQCDTRLRLVAGSMIPATDLLRSSHGSRIYGIHLGSGSQVVKRVPMGLAATVVKLLLEREPRARVVYIEGPGDPPFGSLPNDLQQSMKPCKARSIAELQELVGSCHSVLSGDTGITHIAASMGTHSTILVGPGDIERAHPSGPFTVVATHDPPACMPCYLVAPAFFRNCPFAIKCMTSIAPEDVVTAMTAAPSRMRSP